MCLNCGCGEYDKRHKPTDLTMEDLEMAAKGQKMGIRQAVANIQEAVGVVGQVTQARDEESTVRHHPRRPWSRPHARFGLDCSTRVARRR